MVTVLIWGPVPEWGWYGHAALRIVGPGGQHEYVSWNWTEPRRWTWPVPVARWMAERPEEMRNDTRADVGEYAEQWRKGPRDLRSAAVLSEKWLHFHGGSVLRQIFYARGLPRNYAFDCADEHREPERFVEIRGLDETAMVAWWRRLLASGKEYHSLSFNCCTAIYECLRAGGSDAALRRYPRRLMPITPGAGEGQPLVWFPVAMYDYARQVADALRLAA